ncbi:hypothetical protein ACP4OV_030735 [Aristida adscensionis]
MIKRRYFRQDHGDGSGSSSSSSSSSSSGSDSDHDPAEGAVSDEEEVEEQEEQEGEAGGEELGEGEESEEFEPQVQEESSGYQSEDSDENDVDGPSLVQYDDEHISPRHEEHQDTNLPARKASCSSADSAKSAATKDDALEDDFANCILKCKSVYKCKLCPRIMCLNEEMVMIHLKSKRHARSKKLLEEGRLKMMLNSDGELQEEEETHAERHARIVALAQREQKPKKDSGRQRQNRRRKKRSRDRKEKKQDTRSTGDRKEKKQDTQSTDIKRRKTEQ